MKTSCRQNDKQMQEQCARWDEDDDDGRHALAVDEHEQSFSSTLYAIAPGHQCCSSVHLADALRTRPLPVHDPSPFPYSPAPAVAPSPFAYLL